MTIDELRIDKAVTEAHLQRELAGFMKRTGVLISSIELKTYSEEQLGQAPTVISVKVNIEVKLP